jgi:hypothetical protein
MLKKVSKLSLSLILGGWLNQVLKGINQMAAPHSESRTRRLERFERNGIIVNTYYGENVYQTEVKHPQYNANKAVLVQEYPDSDQAESGHKYWLKAAMSNSLPPLIEQQDAEKAQTRSYKITFKALIRILSPYAHKGQPLKILLLPKHPNCLLVTIVRGTYSGACVYNTRNMEISEIVGVWNNIIGEAQVAICDRQFKEDEEEANSMHDTYVGP